MTTPGNASLSLQTSVCGCGGEHVAKYLFRFATRYSGFVAGTQRIAACAMTSKRSPRHKHRSGSLSLMPLQIVERRAHFSAPKRHRRPPAAGDCVRAAAARRGLARKRLQGNLANAGFYRPHGPVGLPCCTGAARRHPVPADDQLWRPVRNFEITGSLCFQLDVHVASLCTMHNSK